MARGRASASRGAFLTKKYLFITEMPKPRGVPSDAASAGWGPTQEAFEMTSATKWLMQVILLTCALWLVAGSGAAQTVTGQVSGTVVDSSGAVVPGAPVTLTNQGTTVARSTESNDTGGFLFDAVPPGTYTVKVSKQGFRTLERKDVSLSATQRVSLGSIELSVGQVTETISVTASGETISLETAEKTGLLSATQLDLLISRGRDPVNLVKLLPGVSQVTMLPWGEGNPGDIQSGDQSLGGQFGTFTPNMQGLRTYTNNFTLDGQPGGDTDIEGAFNEIIAMDALAEVKAVLTNYPAEYGRNGGPVVAMVSKSGAKDFHGNAYWYKRNENLNANDFFFNRGGIAKPNYRYDQFGFTVGGPIFIPNKFNTGKDKLFFFYSQEHWRINQPGGLNRVNVATAAERAGDFSQSPVKPFDPLTGQPFPGDMIPSNRFNQHGPAILNLQPLPNRDSAQTGGAYNYEWADQREVPKLSQSLRLDFRPSDNDTIYIRGRRWWTNTRAFTQIVGIGGGLPLLRSHYLFTDDSVQVGWTRTFGGTMVNELNAGFRGVKEIGAPERDGEFDSILRSTTGLSGLGQFFPQANSYGIIPQVTWGGGVVINNPNIGFDTRLPIWAGDQRFTILDNFSIVRGSHNPKFGFYFEHTDTSEGFRSFASNTGSFDFSRNPSNPLDSGHPYSNTLLGNFASYVEASSLLPDKGRHNMFEWFAQDTWKLTRRLTLNYGIRFSSTMPWSVRKRSQGAAFVRERYDSNQIPPLYTPAIVNNTRVGVNPQNANDVQPEVFIGAFVPNVGDPFSGMVTHLDTTYPDGWINRFPLQYGPRFGFSYDLFGNGNTALRAGIGITKQTVPSSQNFLWQTTENPPLQVSPQVFYGNIDTLFNSQGVLFPGGVSAYELDMKVPTIYSWSVGIQHNLGSATIMEVSYVGNATRHLFQSTDINTLPYGTRFLPSSQDPTTGGPLPDSFLRPFLGYGGIGFNMANGISNYNSLQVSVNRRFSRGPQFGLSYTYSKALDLTSGDNGGLPYYLPTHSRMYGRSNYDQTHIFSLNYIYNLPKASTHWNNLFSKAVLDGWQLAGVTTFSSGLPYGIGFGTNPGVDFNGGGDGERVNVLSNPQLPSGERTFDRWFDTAAFEPPSWDTTPCATMCIGNASKSPIRGPGINNWDLSVIKMIPVKGESTYFQFRWDLYNAFNHTQFSAVDTFAFFDLNTRQQTNGRFGEVTGTRPPRIIQFALSFYF